MDARKIHDIVMQLARLTAQLVEMLEQPVESNTDEERDRRVAAGECLICGRKFNKGQRVIRGVHQNCKHQLLLRYGDDEAIELGLLLPPKPGGRPSTLRDIFGAIDSESSKKEVEGKPRRNDKGST